LSQIFSYTNTGRKTVLKYGYIGFKENKKEGIFTYISGALVRYRKTVLPKPGFCSLLKTGGFQKGQ